MLTKNRLQWYGTQRWRRMAKAQLCSQPLCSLCLAEGQVVAASVADHILPHKGDYQLFWFGKLQSLCKWHHDSIKQEMERYGHSKQIGDDGWPVDANHLVNRKPGARGEM